MKQYKIGLAQSNASYLKIQDSRRVHRLWTKLSAGSATVHTTAIRSKTIVCSDAYRFHYVDETDVNWRFDRHSNDHSPEKHFHEPPAAVSETALQSCITVEEPRLVAQAVLNLWRRAYETDSVTELNIAQNPP